MIEDNLARLEVISFEEVPSSSYVRCLDATGKSPMYLNPGYIDFAKGAEPPDARYDPAGIGYVVLSTFQHRGGSTSGPLENDDECPRHPGMKLPLSGVCDECE